LFLFCFSADYGRLMWRFLLAFFIFIYFDCKFIEIWGVLADLGRIACIGGLETLCRLFIIHSFWERGGLFVYLPL